ncbi:hypothetical protein H5410_026266 [Solanum commersonii]|uniref:Uncharacterized protein n=1 Tax=Solanum commersonii TaxID=4109 RepID=A0A9J5Z101_SOLCO|nr:hypothetical protein H5410_026266 [Solanum commersonii]
MALFLMYPKTQSLLLSLITTVPPHFRLPVEDPSLLSLKPRVIVREGKEFNCLFESFPCSNVFPPVIVGLPDICGVDYPSQKQ